MDFLPIHRFDPARWPELTPEEFEEMHDNITWILHHSLDIHGEPLSVEERNVLIQAHNDAVARGRRAWY